MIIDGKQIAEEILAGIGDSLRGKRLGIVMGQDDAATQSFIRIKSKVAARLGVEVVHGGLAELLASCDGVLVQLPMANSDELLAQLAPEKDVDGLGPAPAVLPPVAGAVAEVLARNGTDVVGKKIIVVGAGRLVGKPVAQMLKEMGGEVSTVTSTEGSLEDLKTADMVVLGAGSPGFVKPDMLKQGVVLIDAGTSESNGKLAGDADPACAEVASLFTPVPGGIGPIAVAMIFKNLFALSSAK
ncbi:MAG TPA: bifunctional 5,10-methylenetetrahydrofolate dehydrogenase/5,10-methenyltetrahydrofolate cyclohydrolase [Candidatus Paceibacterota bacterium]|nr:bifunctional 5,10-methylenetetrahydrofolate dehydrogenase/5,10-methenyltetrahydrofolate cyclohydrolase [Candidatus Paceibacterota bacterium]